MMRRVVWTLTGILLVSPISFVAAQHAQVTAGDIVRTATVDSASMGLWATGTVLSFSAESLLISDTDGQSLLRLNESIRVQVNRGKRRRTAAGGTLGFFIGGLVSIMDLKTERATRPSQGASLGGVFKFGALGAVLGAAIGSRFGPTIWDDVPVGDDALLAASMPVGGLDPGVVVNVGWWTRLEQEPVDVRAVLDKYAEDLAPIEGTWHRIHDSSSVAVVRESRYEGIDYVAYEPSGRIVGAINSTLDTSTFHFRFPPSTEQYSASLSQGILTVRSRGDTVHQWLRRPETIDSTFIALSHGVTLLEPVVVEAPRVEQRLSDVGFLSREQALSGTFLTREDIIRQNPRTTAELLRRIPGFTVATDGWVSAPRDILCSGVGYYVDGVHADGSFVSTVLPNAIAGMEVYTSAAAVPIQYHVAGNPRCGVILLWTVDGGKQPR